MKNQNDFIVINDATTHNLKHVNLKIPKHKISVFTGVSGSGKSSLVFSTLAAESQRQITKTYSSYIQHQLPKFENPEIGSIKNLPFSIVVNQKAMGGNVRSTVGTYSEIYTGLRLLFSRLAKPFIGYSMAYSFNNTEGMCPNCQGTGMIQEIVVNRLISSEKSLNDGAINFPTFQPGGWRLARYTESGLFNNDLPLKDWKSETLDLLINGQEQKLTKRTDSWPKTAKYIGVIPRIEDGFLKKDNPRYKKEVEKITETAVCPECNGTRLNDKALSAKINQSSIANCSSMPLADLNDWLQQIETDELSIIVDELITKIANLQTVGLGYLTLDRITSTLSGGEAQRLKLANHLNSPLNDILYIFDEPSTGLHPHDLVGINKIFTKLRDKGNTIAIVDHDPEVIKIADQVFNLGEKAGAEGGHITFEGNVAGLVRSDTLTGEYLRDKGTITSAHEVKEFKNFYELKNVSKFNIKDLSTKFPKNTLTVVTGVAGSGKSTLINIFKEQHPESIVLNQKPIRSSYRSNVLTYLNVFDKLRKLFAKATGKPAAMFSFNGAGACPVCKGKGTTKLDLAYMGDITQTCELCNGTRYSQETLQLKYEGYNIAEILDLTVAEANEIFHTELTEALDNLIKVGLDYVKLGQSLDTFSGGELQRVKLAKILIKDAAKLLVLDEPTSGLHEANVQSLINLLKQLLVERGLTIIVIEHNLRVIGQANWLVDIGPYAGANGGKLLFEGTPHELVDKHDTLTAKAVRNYFD
ncbi:MAG: excinuclease ABC subunit UvrA [Micrococcaceae bacterium]